MLLHEHFAVFSLGVLLSEQHSVSLHELLLDRPFNLCALSAGRHLGQHYVVVVMHHLHQSLVFNKFLLQLVFQVKLVAE